MSRGGGLGLDLEQQNWKRRVIAQPTERTANARSALRGMGPFGSACSAGSWESLTCVTSVPLLLHKCGGLIENLFSFD